MTIQPTSPFVAGVFPKRIGRLSYFLRLLLLLALYYAGLYVIHQCPVGPKVRLGMVLVFVAVFLGYLFCYTLMPRLRDFGLPALAIVLFFIPILNTLFLFGMMFGPQDYWHTLRRKAL